MASNESGDKPKCKYWNKCFRKDKKHCSQFSQPGDIFDEDETEEVIGGATGGDAESSTKVNKLDLGGKKVLFVGTFKKITDKSGEAEARACGCVVTVSPAEDVDIVVVGTDGGKKAAKAKELGLRIVTEEYWQNLLSRANKQTKGKAATSDKVVEKPKADKKTKLKRQRTHNLSDEESDDGESVPKLRPKRTRSSTSLGGSTSTSIGGSSSKKKPARDESDMDTSDENEAVLKGNTKRDLSDSEETTPSPKRKKAEPAAAKGATASPSKGKKKIAKCKYWDKCYRKEKAHIDMFLHPSDDPSELADDGPQTLEDGEDAEVEVGSRKFRIKRTGQTYYCNCIGWKTQNKAVDMRTCKHLKEYLGEDVECKRVGTTPTANTPNKGGEATIFRNIKHKNVSLLLAHKWAEEKDPKGWWISEKLDGVRAFWDGKSFYSRLGNEFIPPPAFIKNYPTDMTLDGELFGGRAKFQSTVAIVKNAGSARWSELEYHIFDAPSIGSKPFEDRIKAVKDYFEENDAKTAVVVKHTKCTGRKMIEDELKKVEDLGGEGLMIRQPRSKYEHSRSHTLLKIKNFYDAEAEVIGYDPGKGRNAGRVGALRCVMECGKKFSVGSGLSDKERNKPPKIGSIITYKFQEYTNSGSPRFPTYIGVRIDATEAKDAVLPAGKMQGGDA